MICTLMLVVSLDAFCCGEASIMAEKKQPLSEVSSIGFIRASEVSKYHTHAVYSSCLQNEWALGLSHNSGTERSQT